MTYILGLDVGSKTIGIAKISLENEIATPVLTLKRQSVKKDVARILELCVKMSVTEVVVGLPIQLNGQEGRSAKLAQAWKNRIIRFIIKMNAFQQLKHNRE